MIRFILQILIISLPILSVGQSSKIKRIYLGSTKKWPVQNAKVYYEKYYGAGCCQNSGLIFEPIDDSVFSVYSAIVYAVFDLGNSQTVVTKDSLDRFYTYVNLSKVCFAKNDRINKGSLIGLINREGQKNSEFIFMASDKKGRNWNEEKVWALINDEQTSERTSE